MHVLFGSFSNLQRTYGLVEDQRINITKSHVLKEIGLHFQIVLTTPCLIVNIIHNTCVFNKGTSIHTLPITIIKWREIAYLFGFCRFDNVPQILKRSIVDRERVKTKWRIPAYLLKELVVIVMSLFTHSSVTTNFTNHVNFSESPYYFRRQYTSFLFCFVFWRQKAKTGQYASCHRAATFLWELEEYFIFNMSPWNLVCFPAINGILHGFRH